MKLGHRYANEEAEIVPKEPEVELDKKSELNLDTTLSSEIDRTEKDIEIQNDMAETGLHDVYALETLTIAMKKHRAQGLSLETARISKIATEALYRKLNVKDPSNVMVSLEAFDSKHSKQLATRLSLENNDSILAKIWDTVTSVIKVIAEKITKFFGLIAGKDLSKRADLADQKFKEKRDHIENPSEEQAQNFIQDKGLVIGCYYPGVGSSNKTFEHILSNAETFLKAFRSFLHDYESRFRKNNDVIKKVAYLLSEMKESKWDDSQAESFQNKMTELENSLKEERTGLNSLIESNFQDIHKVMESGSVEASLSESNIDKEEAKAILSSGILGDGVQLLAVKKANGEVERYTFEIARPEVTADSIKSALEYPSVGELEKIKNTCASLGRTVDDAFISQASVFNKLKRESEETLKYVTQSTASVTDLPEAIASKATRLAHMAAADATGYQKAYASLVISTFKVLRATVKVGFRMVDVA